jgi:hypothetical protein
MLTFLMHIRTAWNDYFTGSPTSTISGLHETTQTLSGTNVYVSNCLFRSVMSSNRGGAFYCTSVTFLLVESSSFFSCRTNVQCGGAIYFSNGNSQCVLYEVCGYDCYSTYTSSPHYQFAYIYVNNGGTSKNYVNYSSIVRCVNGRSDSYITFYLVNGKICCPSVNISMNKCQYYSGIYCNPFKDSNSFTCSFSYSSFANNIANGYICFHFWRNANCEFKSCNILRNTQGSLDSYGIFYIDDNLKIDDSCILENKANRIFHQYSSSYTITLTNCTVDSFSSNVYLTTRNTVTKSFILALNHMSTQNCHSEYDSAGTLTPIIQTPSPSKKQRHYYTGNIFFNQCQLSDVVSLHKILIFNFIHPYASNDFW